ncbi:Beta,beta-carotene 9',10'-oxygenase [Halocaridina rubra]|uniref:Beta,beta-carotene 9',10'-oxygenase n=1 Tax=Halocaridina rubra TaxID=373956 RepID=A0AAN9A4J9_HALRR
MKFLKEIEDIKKLTGIYFNLVTLLVTGNISDVQAEADSRSTYWLRSCEKDTTSPVEGRLQGTIPDWIEGRLIRVGPGIRHVGNTSYNHLFDPLAILHQVEIRNGRATYISKFLESDAYEKNMKAQTIVVLGFGTAAFPDPCKTLFESFAMIFETPEMGDNCLVNILQATDQLIAMTETDTVRIINPSNLHVIGDGVRIPDYVSVERATAHPHVDKDGTIYNLAFLVTNKGPAYAITSHKNGHIQEASLEAVILARWKFYPSYMHSFVITENYYVLLESPMTLNAGMMILAKYTGTVPAEAMTWFPEEKTRFRVIERSTGKEIDVEYLSDPFFTFHPINAFEHNGFLVVDVSAIASGDVFKALYYDNLKKPYSDPTKFKFVSVATRYVLPLMNTPELPMGEELLIDTPELHIIPEDSQIPTRIPSAKKVGENVIDIKGVSINDMFFEMPRINYAFNGHQYRYAYGVGTAVQSLDFSSIIKLDIKTGKELVWKDDDYFVSEPVFVANSSGENEDSGVLLTLLLHRQEEEHHVLLILDAHDLKEIARSHFSILGAATPTFHGQFISFNDEVHGY